MADKHFLDNDNIRSNLINDCENKFKIFLLDLLFRTVDLVQTKNADIKLSNKYYRLLSAPLFRHRQNAVKYSLISNVCTINTHFDKDTIILL